ncbi:60S ribosomal export protein NMD3 [Carex littledalei]|uniref:60S ribosomal export protein NMD3 n=1 Tax=Carex littledalei TaxID=544730 RepID=A0A833R658_9POAL|nr:60S ribosomal export protein NMD3 [Carex littledalei]
MAVNPSNQPSAGMFFPTQTPGTVLCCTCGVPMAPNPANMCVRCLRLRVDITEGLPRQATVNFCPDCSSYLQPPNKWMRFNLESQELLHFLVKRLHTRFSRLVTVCHAEFIFTEPHSKRLKIRLRVRREVLNGAVLEQPHIVEFVVHDKLCTPCSRLQANPDQWVAAVQLRQHVTHRRTFLFLEQLILRHGAATRAVRIAAAPHGLDFFFASRSHANRLVDFLNSVAPIHFRTDKQLVSHDEKSSVYNYKHTFSVEISPICREDLICLPPKVARSLGNLGPLVICTKVSNSIILMDPFTLRVAYINATQYWSDPFRPLLSSRQLVEYSILDIELESDIVTVAGSRYQLASVEVARMSDFSNIFRVKTHIGHLLNVGDNALGYDLFGANTNDMEMDKYKGLVLPECLLVKKSYEETRAKRRGKQRNFKLKRLEVEVDATNGRKGEEDKKNDEYRKFLEELEENPELRFNISLYKNENYEPSEMGSSMADVDETPSVPVEELVADLEDLDITDDQD